MASPPRDTRPARLYPALRACLRWPPDAPMDGPVRPAPSPARASAPAAQVRASVAAPKRPSIGAALDPQLAKSARAALFFQSADDEQTFDIALDEALLGNVRCRISLGPAGVDATFVVDDAGQRWLLDGESARLRQALTDKGLTVRHVRVVQVGDATAPDLLT